MYFIMYLYYKFVNRTNFTDSLDSGAIDYNIILWMTNTLVIQKLTHF